MTKAHKTDYTLLIITALLIVLGIIVLSSISGSFSLERYGTPYYFLNHQVLYGLLPGIILAFLAFRTSLVKVRKYAHILLIANIFLMLLVFMPVIGASFGGATRWLDFGLFSVQPSEFLKVTFILYLAAWLTKGRDIDVVSSNKGKWQKKLRKINLSSLTHGLNDRFLPFLAIIGLISLFLILQPDVSTLSIIALVGILVYFSAGGSILHSLSAILAGFGFLLLLIKIAPYRFNRLLVFLNPETDPMGIGYQVKQALIAVGSGGISGLGLGMSVQKAGFLPQPMSDAVFAVFAEETGIIGSLILIILFLAFLWRGIEISKKVQDRFLRLTALGITLWITIQALTNIGAIVGVLPLTGIPLPFISYGGSAIISELIGVGILLNISRHVPRD